MKTCQEHEKQDSRKYKKEILKVHNRFEKFLENLEILDKTTNIWDYQKYFQLMRNKKCLKN